MFLIPIGPIQLPLVVGQRVQVPVPMALELTHIAGSIQVGSATIDLSNDAGVLYTLAVGAAQSILERLDKVPVPDGGVLIFTTTLVGLGAAGCYVTVWGAAA
jgi:hypothetical protein